MLIGPSSGLAFARKALLLIGQQSADVQCGAPDDGHVLISMPLADARTILIEDHIEHPMDLVLDTPMFPDPGIETLGIGLGAGEIEADLLGGFSTQGPLPGRTHAYDRAQVLPAGDILQQGRGVDHIAGPCLDTSVAFVHLLAGGAWGMMHEEHFHLQLNTGLVALDTQQVVASAFADLLGNIRLATHGINADDRPLEVQHGQQFRDGRDLIAFPIHLHLGQYHLISAAPCADQVDRPLTTDRVVAPSKGLPIDGYQLALSDLAYLGGPTHEAALEDLGVEPMVEFAQHIMGGRAPIQKMAMALKPLQANLREVRYLCEALAIGHNSSHGQEDQRMQWIVLGTVHPWVDEKGEMSGEGHDAAFRRKYPDSTLGIKTLHHRSINRSLWD